MCDVKLHRDSQRGDLVVAVSTNAGSDEDFLGELNATLQAALKERLHQTSDIDCAADIFSIDLSAIVPRAVEICCKLRGYKADVAEHRVIVAGRIMPDDVVGAFEQDHVFRSPKEQGRAFETV